MQVIKNKQLIDNHWTYLTDDAPVVAGNICVSLARWQTEKTQLIAHDGNLGVRIAPADDVNQLVEDLPKLALIELAVSDFADGRSFSQAHLLRNRHAYQGEIRAVGNYLADQAFYFSRVGVNAFESEHLAQTQNTLNDFTVFYQ
jgi:uncharacterized protein (DUF934 family)